jgi:hypothetical protein
MSYSESYSDEQKQKMELVLRETLDWYKVNPRSQDIEGNCVYFRERDGAMCAFGRCLVDAKSFQKAADDRFRCRTDQILGNIFRYDSKDIEHDPYLRPEYQGLPLTFWQTVQTAHDTIRFWATENGGDLTNEGRDHLRMIVDRFDLSSDKLPEIAQKVA